MAVAAGKTASTTKKAKAPALRIVKNPEERVPQAAAPRRKRRSIAELSRRDGVRLLIVTAALNCLGLVMVLSASSVESISTAGTPWSLFEKQVMWTVIGLGAFLLCRRLDLATIRRYSLPLLVLCCFLLLVVLAPGIGKTVGGSSRWVGAGPIRIQPSELAKISFALFVADLLARREHTRDQVREIVRPVVLVLGVMAILILKQPDLGTAVVLVCIAASMLFAGGVNRRLLGSVIAALAFIGGILTLAAPYRRERFFAFLHPFSQATTSGYQMVQSLVALGAGHLVGTGVGGSIAKWNFLPNAWTDFIFAIIGNELGLIGSIAVILAFCAFAYLGIRIAARTTDRFSHLLAIGITCWIVAQAFINIGGVVSILPETGVPLPFLSSGGSSLVVALAGVGLLWNIASNPTKSTARGGALPEPRGASASRSARRTAPRAGAPARQRTSR